ncbi:hypothetical protein GIB67_006884 [Kingdonia uniflora]|uniref:Uncharacterized protein n=1 Tax=Kingdonia uniflora TaxID=39325 RepID=A0A7J7L0A1_9MAGN|nr:hypothetical protein GIB67_006884 [Kingdonia uniflora]
MFLYFVKLPLDGSPGKLLAGRDCRESSSQVLTKSLKGKSISTDASFEPCSRRNRNDMIEELTLKKYPNPKFVVVGSSTNREAKSIRQSQWHHLYQLGGRSGTRVHIEKMLHQADLEDVGKRHMLITQASSSKDPLRLEAFPRATSLSNMIEARLIINIDRLENAYFTMKSQVQKEMNQNPDDRLRMFFDSLCKYARYSTFEVCETLRNADHLNSANVIFSLSFDQDEDFFTAVGVSKKIKIFDFHNLLDDSIDIHYQVIELSSKSKLSCICWNNNIKNYLALTDYDGVVQIWDTCTCQGFSQYAEHQKGLGLLTFLRWTPQS